MKRCIPLMVSCFCSLTPVYAQNDSTAIRIYAEQLKKLKLSPLFATYYYERKVNLSKVAALKKAGVNLYSIEKQGMASTYKECSLLADAAIVGTVISRTYNTDYKAYYHTTYKIRVDNKLKGDNLADTIAINLTSGMVGNKYVINEDEPILELGQQKLFFLNYIKFDKLETAQKSGLITEKIDITSIKSSSPFYISDNFIIKSGYLFHTNKKTDKIEKAIEKVKEIDKINQGD